MFSVVIPLYNKAQSITATLKSVLAQSFEDFEIVLVNDGSTDGSLDVAKKIQDPRIRIIDKENGGVSSARNKGIQEAKYEWIAFLDGDDLWTDDHLEIINKMIMKFPEDKVFCTSFLYSNDDLSQKGNDKVEIIEDYFIEAIKSHFFWTSIVVINKTIFSKVGDFKEFLSRGEDLELWARIGRKHRIIRSKIITGIYVQESENKASFGKYDLEKSFINTIDFNCKSLSNSEYQYFKKLVLNKFKTALISKDWKLIFAILKKYKAAIFFK